MDQFISTMGSKNNALLIDCRSCKSKEFLLSNPDVAILIINSNVKHQLEGSEYSSRRAQCEQVAEILGKSLRDSSMTELDEKLTSIDKEAYRRARHVIGEIKRTVDASQALKENEIVQLGILMNQSHDSLRYIFLRFGKLMFLFNS